MSVDLQQAGPDEEPITRAKLASPDPDSVEQRAIGGLEILQDPATITRHKTRVETRDAFVLEYDVATVVSPDKQLLLFAAPVEGEEDELLTAVSNEAPSAATRAHQNARQPRAQTATRST
jgi:hypothetical protein